MTRYISISFAIFLSWGIFITDTQAQCSLKIDYQVESTAKGAGIFKVKSLEGPEDLKIQLYDLNMGKVVSEREVTITRSFQSIFTEVRPSLYILYVWIQGCKKPMALGGEKHGILIEN